MRRSLVRAAVVFGVAMVVTSAVLIAGAAWVADRLMTRFEAAVHEHGVAVRQSGERISNLRPPTAYSIHLRGPVSIAEPVTIRGPRDDGALPVNATVGD